MKQLLLKQSLLVLMLVLWSSIYAQHTPSYQIGITTGAFTPNIATDADYQVEQEEYFNNTYFRLLQFYAIPSDEKRKQWETQGLELTDYLPGNVYFAVIDSRFDLQLVKTEIRAILPVDSRFKLDQSIFYNGIPAHAIEAGKAKLIVNYYAGLNMIEVSETLKNKGFDVVSYDALYNSINISITPNRLNELVTMPFIQFVSAIPETPVVEGNDHHNSSGRSNYINTGYNSINYNGAGVTIAVGESGTLTQEPDCKGRMILEQSSTISSHKIGVMQYMAGAGNLDPSDRNQAWGANVVSGDTYPNYAALFASDSLLYTNHSYGFAIAGNYDNGSRNHDLRIATIPQHMVLYSSGNSGTSTGYAPYAFANWANITGSTKMSKNMMTVGSFNSTETLTGFSSRGPLYDGRIAPNVVIEGGGGTSHAVPKATGIFAMLTQAYKAQHSGVVPPSSLLRAIVFNSADDVENPGPDYKTGFGRINVRRAYNLMTANQFLNATVSNGNTNTHTINMPANTKQVRVMIVWPDVAAAVNANPAIVNNLNMVVKDPSNVSYNPWVLDASLPSSTTKLDAVAVRGIDSINTMELITVDNPAAGTWNIEVTGYNVPSGPQLYYLTYEFLAEEIKFTFPLSGDRLKSNDVYQLKWDSYGNSGTFALDYQLDGGSWIGIAAGIDASLRNYTWTAPLVTGIHTIKFRVKKGNLISESDVNYIGRDIDNFRVSKACSDVVTLKWSPLTGATSYKVYRLGAKYMEEVTSNITFNASGAVLTGQSVVDTEYYAVSALSGTFEGKRTNSIIKTPGDISCSAINWTGITSTNWFDSSNWSPVEVPTRVDNVVIPSAPANQPLIADTGAACRNLTISAGASLTMSNMTGYTLSVYGDWMNNGTYTRGIGTVNFTDTSDYQEITGTSTTNFYILKITKGAIDRIVEATALITLNAPSNPLVITSGTFKLSSASTITPFTNSAGALLSSGKCLWNNGGTINYGNFTWNLDNARLILSYGTINMGTNNDNTINYLNNGSILVEDGTLNVAGRISPNSGTSTGKYTQYGGTVTVNMVGSTSTTRAPFELNTGVPFTMTGGTLIVAKRSSHTTVDLSILSNTINVTGGTIQIGNTSTPANQTIRLIAKQVFNLVILPVANITAQLVNGNTIVKNDLTIGGTLDANTRDLNVGGDWVNNASFFRSTGLVTFDGASPQHITGSSATTFNNLTLNNPTTLSLSGTSNTTVKGILNFNTGILSTENNTLILDTNGSVIRTTGHVFGNFQKAIPTGSSVATTFEIGDSIAANYCPVNLAFNSVSTLGFINASTTPGDISTIGVSSLSSSKSVNRHWTLTNNGVGFTTYDATFNYLASDMDAGTIWDSLVCGNLNASTWTYPTVGTQTATATQITGMNTFGKFQLAESNIPVPVTLLYFNARLDRNKQVQLNWSTASEVNNDYFIVERSADANKWNTLAKVDGSGNSTSTKKYALLDALPTTGINYYRLVQVDFDGTVTHSDIQSVVLDENKTPVLSPNPTTGLITISETSGNDLHVYSLMGNDVSGKINQSYTNAKLTLDLSGLDDGLYIIMVNNQSVKVMKNTR